MNLFRATALASLAVITPFAVEAQTPSVIAYVVSSSTNTITAYVQNRLTGALTAIFSPVPTGSNPTSIAIDYSGLILYVTNRDSNTISSYHIDAQTGELTALPGSPVPAGKAPVYALVSSSQNFLYVVNEGDNNVYLYAIGANGALTLSNNPLATGLAPLLLFLDILDHAYVANSGDNSISDYGVDPLSGALSPIGKLPTGDSPGGLAIYNPPTGLPYVYATFPHGNYGLQYTEKSDGSLNLSGTIPTGNGPTGILVYPFASSASGFDTGLAVANTGSDNISAFTISSSTGATTPIGLPVAAGIGPTFLAVDPSARFVYATNSGSNNVSGYNISPTGGLTPTTGSPYAVAFNPTSIGMIALGLQPPVLAKSFGDLSIPPGGSTNLTFTITNPNAFPLRDIFFPTNCRRD